MILTKLFTIRIKTKPSSQYFNLEKSVLCVEIENLVMITTKKIKLQEL